MEETTTLSRKERERLNRKKEIMEAATILFSEKGFTHTTLEEIAAKAEFGIGTIYNYFQSKEDILKSILDYILEESNNLMETCARNTGTFIEFIKLYIHQVVARSYKNKRSIIILVSMFTSKFEKPINISDECLEQKTKSARDTFINKIKEGIKNNEIKDMDPERFSFFFDHLLFPYVTHLIKKDELNESEIQVHADFISDIVLNGILVR